MSAPVKPTPAQLTALQLASQAPIRYYKGGWYSIPDMLVDQQLPSVGGATVTPNTLNACEDRGWLDENRAVGIYNKRWTLTPAGRAVLDAAEVQS